MKRSKSASTFARRSRESSMQKHFLPTIIALAVIAFGVFVMGAPAPYKTDILTQVLPSLLSGLVAIAAITERATAVLNGIWFGEKRANAEDGVRLANRQLEAAKDGAEKNNALAQAAV